MVSIDVSFWCHGRCNRIAAYCVLLFMFGSAMSLGWISFYGFWSKNKDFTFLKKISSQTLLLFTMSATCGSLGDSARSNEG